MKPQTRYRLQKYFRRNPEPHPIDGHRTYNAVEIIKPLQELSLRGHVVTAVAVDGNASVEEDWL